MSSSMRKEDDREKRRKKKRGNNDSGHLITASWLTYCEAVAHDRDLQIYIIHSYV